MVGVHDKCAQKSHGTSVTLFRERKIPFSSVLFKIPLAENDRQEGDSEDVEDHPGELNAEV